MIAETSLAFYPKYDAPLTHSCVQCLNPICTRLLSEDTIVSGSGILYQQLFANPTIQEQSGYNTYYFWRKYYSDLSMGFSKQLSTNSKHYSDYGNCMEMVGQPKLNVTDVSGQSNDVFRKSKSVQIWRPFSPSLEVDSPYFLDNNNSIEDIKTVKRVPKRVYPFIIPSIEKLNHSNSSVFIPVKKKSHVYSKSPCGFQNNLHLSTYLRAHTGSKPYACDYLNCTKSFARNEELTRHRRIHSGYKPHLCNTCGKCFGRKDHLTKHIKTHLHVSEKKVYVCCVSGCGHRYTRSDALTRHKSNAHAIHKTRPTSGKVKKLKE